MKWKTLLLPVVAVLAFVPQTAESQSLIATYYRCSTAYEGEADFIMNTVLGDVYEARAEAGDITGWGWVEHQAGGAWRRISTISAEDRTTAWNMWGEIIDELEEEHPNAWHRFNEICDSHDDYIWNVVASAEGTDPGATPNLWVSTYWTCDEVTESRADELLPQMAQVFDKHIAAGHLSGWAWYAHDLGGRVRRLLTLAAAEDFDLLEAREMVVNELQTEHAEALAEFSAICNGHVDYVWANGRAGDDS